MGTGTKNVRTGRGGRGVVGDFSSLCESEELGCLFIIYLFKILCYFDDFMIIGFDFIFFTHILCGNYFISKNKLS
ncbi:MAG: hypothetical protein LBD88_04880 [Candidatus Peribacteria bacterium]|nr:hypothetical protein [Candidatus Peribacteria bacterium]